jgi:hypothetical protein
MSGARRHTAGLLNDVSQLVCENASTCACIGSSPSHDDVLTESEGLGADEPRGLLGT